MYTQNYLIYIQFKPISLFLLFKKILYKYHKAHVMRKKYFLLNLLKWVELCYSLQDQTFWDVY